MLTLPCRRDRHLLCSGAIQHRLDPSWLDRLLRRTPVYVVPCRCGCHTHPALTPTA